MTPKPPEARHRLPWYAYLLVSLLNGAMCGAACGSYGEAHHEAQSFAYGLAGGLGAGGLLAIGLYVLIEVVDWSNV